MNVLQKEIEKIIVFLKNEGTEEDRHRVKKLGELAEACQTEKNQKELLDAVALFLWGAQSDVRDNILGLLTPKVALKLLSRGLKGTDSQAISALEYLKKYPGSLAGLLEKEVIALAEGDSTEVCLAAGELLLLANSAFVAGQPWLTLRLASFACGKAPLDQRINIISAMAEIGERSQYFHIEHCADRDAVSDALVKSGQWTSLLSLLRSSLLHWNADAASSEDMLWLIRALLKVKEISLGQEVPVCFKNGRGGLKIPSRVMGELLVGEALSAAAGAWISCLRGPGGVNICLENQWIFSDEQMSVELLEVLYRDPVAFISLLKEVEDSVPPGKTEIQGLTEDLLLTYMMRGALAAEYSLFHLLEKCLALANKNKLPHIVLLLTHNDQK